MKLIGLAGRKRVGKDTAAHILKIEGYSVVKFAGALKDMLRMYLNYVGAPLSEIEEMIEGDLKEIPSEYLDGRSPRHAMQTLGTEWGRDLMSSTFWVNSCIRRCARFSKAVITDVRFPNEAEAVRQAGGVVLRITRHNRREGDNHASENFIDTLDVNHEISNNGSINELHEKLLTIVKGQS